MKKLILYLIAGILFQGDVWAEEPSLEGFHEILIQRAELTAQIKENLQEELDKAEDGSGKTKSVTRSVLYSAVVPGLGQLYAKSYIKAGLFAAAEVAAWAVNIHYDNLGDDKEAEYRQFGDQNWSEQRYWSYIYNELRQMGTTNLPDYQTYMDNNDPIIHNDDYLEARDYLRQYEHELPGFTHTLPETKTQQYYEMIGKYPSQFGYAWEDASFNETYNGYTDDVTPMNDHYTDLSRDAESLYRKAGYGSMAALVNHIIAAVDAGFTTRSYNRRQMRFSYDNRQFNGEYVNMFGVDFVW